jgi:fibronectin-binding autotransporter adhesin
MHPRNLSVGGQWIVRTVSLLVALALLFTSGASGVTRNWQFGNGIWSVPGNWSGAVVPVGGDAASIGFADGVARTITYDYVGPAVTLASVGLDLTGGSGTNVTLSMSANNLTALADYVGYNGRGTLTQTGGTNTIAAGAAPNYMDIGAFFGSTGTYNLSGTGVLTVNAPEYLGDIGIGFFNQNGGTHSISGPLFMGYNAGGQAGTYTMNSGSLLTGGIQYVGYQVTGTFTQNGGTNNASAGLQIGALAGGSGTYNLGGSGMLTNNNAVEWVGNQGFGAFNQNGGANIVGGGFSLNIGGGSVGNGTYTLNSGTLTAGTVASGSAENVGVTGNGTFNQTGGTNNILGAAGVNSSASLFIGGTSGGFGTYMLSGGSTTVAANVWVGSNFFDTGGSGSLAVSGTGVLTAAGTLTVSNHTATAANLSGGTINVGGLNLKGPLNWTSGTLNLTTNVTFDSTALVSTTPGAFGQSLALGSNQTFMITGNEGLGGTGPFSLTLNSGSSHYVSGAITLNTTGTITQNPGSSLFYTTLTQAGGTVNGTLQNQGNFIYQSGFFNGRLLNQGTATLGPSFTAGNGVENDTTLSVAAGQTLTVNSAGLDNLGTFNLTGGMLSGNGPLLNDFGGRMNASGTLNPALTNLGILNLTGVLRTNSSVTNKGTLTGSGTLIGAFSNPAGASVAVGAGNVLAISNAWTNAGLLNMQGAGATLGGGTITNTGTIQGLGTINSPILNTSGAIRANGGELDLGGSGNTNTAAGQIQSTTGNTVLYIAGLSTNDGNIALQGGAFDNNNFSLLNTGQITGFGTFRSGALTNNGTITLTGGLSFIASPSVVNSAGNTIFVQYNPAIFTGLVTNNGTFKVTSTTASFGGGFTGNPPPPGALSAPASLPRAVGGLDGSGTTTIDAAGVIQASYLRQSSLTDAGQILLRPSSAGGDLSTVNSLTLTGSGQFDLNDNDLVIDYSGASPAATIRSYLVRGFNGGNWNGAGVASGAAHNDSGFQTALGYAENSTLGYATFDGQGVDSTSLLIKYTYYGDNNLDGKVDVNDFKMFLDGLVAASGSSWSQGDYTYDGKVDLGNDFNLFLRTYLAQGGALGDLAPTLQNDAELSVAQKSQLLSVIPEPSMAAAVLIVSSVCGACRRRRCA